MAAVRKLADLTDEDRRALEAWLQECARTWNERSLDDFVHDLRAMVDRPWQLLALTSVLKLDLKQQWQMGKQVSVDSYLDAYPELGGKSGVPAELIVAEMKARAKAGMPVDLDAYVEAYPSQAAELRSLLGGSAAAAGSTRKMRTQTPSAPGPAISPTPSSPAPQTARTSPRQAMSAPAATPSAAPPPPPSPSAPTLSALSGELGRYRIEKQLGQGGMGSVYKAYDTELHRHVALKVPQFGPDDGGEVLERFKQEARTAATLRHTNLCQVFDVGTIDGTFFLTMEFIEGQSLESYVAAQKGVSQRFIAMVMARLARALKTAHAKNVIHRDLKPSNIMMREADGTLEPVIVDFGLARRIDPGSARLTQSGMVIGTWPYMTPEQLCGDPNALGPTCDIYALGVIMYELLAGKLPFDAPGQVVRGNPTRPSALRPDLDHELEEIILKAMAVNPETRYASMGDLATALTDYLRMTSGKLAATKVTSDPAVRTLRQPKAEVPGAPDELDARPSSANPKIIAGAAATAVCVLGGALGLWSFMSSGRGRGNAASKEPDIAKAPALTTPSPSATTDPDVLVDRALQAIRASQFDDARSTLARYLAGPASRRKDEAQTLIADLDRAVSKNDARNRARGRGDAEIKKRIAEGFDDMLDEIHTPVLRDVYAATLMEAFRAEDAARIAARPSGDLALRNTGAMPKRKSAGPPPGPSIPRGSNEVPVRQPEPGFNALYNGQNYDGWTATAWQNLPAKRGGSGFHACPPSFIAHREGSALVSGDVRGSLVTEKLYQIASFKFDYTISAIHQRPQVKLKKAAAPSRPYAVAYLRLDQPTDLGNTTQCHEIGVQLLPGELGKLVTESGAHREITNHPARPGIGRRLGEWNEIEIRFGDGSMQILLNGVEVNRLAASRRINCRVGFTFGNVEARFANVRVNRR
jgi:serine/threonine protein kinase